MIIMLNSEVHGPIALGYTQALINIKQFIEDCPAELELLDTDEEETFGGRFIFFLRSVKNPSRTFDVMMPSCLLEKVRYTNSGTQKIFEFPRVYVDGSSWAWNFALITEEQITGG